MGKTYPKPKLGAPFTLTVLLRTCRFASFTLPLTMLTSMPAWAADHSSQPEVTLEDITVTATKSPTSVRNTIAQTTTIDANTLQHYRGQSVLDVLKTQAGVSVRQNGGDGTLSNFYMRGFDSKQILVLIDGIRYSSLSAGGAALGLLPADQIDRIEILHGASGSSLYGSDAMGGVIQVFTKGQDATRSNVAVTLGAGSEDNYKAQVTGQYVADTTTLSLSAGQQKTAGIDATLPSANYNIHYPDKDGFKSTNYSLVAKQRLNDQISVGMTGLYADSTTHYDSSVFDITTFKSNPYPDTYSEQKNAAANAFVDYQTDKFNAQLKYGQSVDHMTAYDGATPTGGKFDTAQKQANLQLGYRLPVGQLIGGAEWLKQSLDSTTKYNKIDKRTIKSGFIGYQLNKPDHDFQAHIRHDDNSQYGNQTTYNVATAYRVLPNTRVGASYATGFRVPTFNDIQYGVDNIKPETSKNTELFIENASPLHTTRLTGFFSNLDDKIIINPKNNYLSQNVDKVKIQGANLTSDWQFNRLMTGISYTHQSVKDDKGENQDKFLIYTPKDQGKFYIGYTMPEFDIRAEVEHVGERFTDMANSKSLDRYTLLNLIGNYYLNRNLSLNSRINNLTNQDYQTSEGYQQKGINTFVSMTYQWF